MKVHKLIADAYADISPDEMAVCMNQAVASKARVIRGRIPDAGEPDAGNPPADADTHDANLLVLPRLEDIETSTPTAPVLPQTTIVDHAVFDHQVEKANAVCGLSADTLATSPWSPQLLTDFYAGKGFFTGQDTCLKHDVESAWEHNIESLGSCADMPNKVSYPSECKGVCENYSTARELAFAISLRRHWAAVVSAAAPNGKPRQIVGVHLCLHLQGHDCDNVVRRSIFIRVADANAQYFRHRPHMHCLWLSAVSGSTEACRQWVCRVHWW